MDVSSATNTTAEAATYAAKSTESATSTTKASEDALANRDTFLQLLVAQIKNQDPLNPTDSVQFLSQLAQFSELEQLIGIREDLSSLGDTLSASSDAEAEVSTSA